MARYDFLIIGAGFFGVTCARLLTDAGFKCLIIEKESKVGGLASTTEVDGIMCHDYGQHVLHTDDAEVWMFLLKYGTIVPTNKYVKVQNGNKYYSFPLTMDLFKEVYDTVYPKDAKKLIEHDQNDYGVSNRRNLEEESVYLAGFKAYMLTMKPYYEKLYGKEAKDISASAIRELDTVYKYTSGYYQDKYTGIPAEGYTKMLENMLGDDIDIMFNKDFILNRDKYSKLADIIIATCPIDRYNNYIYGSLPWVTLDVDTRKSQESLGVGTVRTVTPGSLTIEMCEHDSFLPGMMADTHYISYITPSKWTPEKKCMFAANDYESEELFEKYISFVNENFDNIVFGGRQGMYRNISMCESVRFAMDLCNDIISARTAS